MRIATAGLGHETNTFCPLPTTYEDFVFLRGAAILADLVAGVAPAKGVDLVPTFVANAPPGGLVHRSAYQRLKEDLLGELQSALPVDGVYLDLHGAMEVEELGDGEGDLVSAVRALVGDDTLISVSLDLHGNISPTLVDRANILTALRTAPHRDGAQTRGRALKALVRALKEGLRPVSALVKPPLLLAGEAAMTGAEPAASLYSRLAEVERLPGILDASLLIGCAWTDSPYTTASTIVVAERDRELAQREANGLAHEVWARRADFGFGMETASPDEAIRLAMEDPRRPVYLSDSGDNVTGGGAGDIPFITEHLLALGTRDVLVAGLTDREAVQQCTAAGEGAEVSLAIGGKIDRTYRPLAVSGRVVHLARGARERTDAPALATVRVGGVDILLATDRRPFTTRASIAQAGVDPMRYKVVVVKQGYLFPDLADHASRGIMALTPGATDLHLERLAYHRLRRPIFPLDGEFTWAPEP